jgi:riboflavin kinase/FMN adenylyltransferase
VPTANLDTENPLLPMFGIYATHTLIAGAWQASVTSVGVRPTIGDGRVTVETFVLDGTHDLYGARLRVAFVKRLREERKFDSLAELTAQMRADIEQTRALFARARV